MTPQPLTAEFLLLAHSDEDGKALIDSTKLKAAVAGAAIVDLTLDGALRLTEPGDPEFKPGRLVRTTRHVSDPLLAQVVEMSHDRKPKDAVGRIGGASAWRNRAGEIKDAVMGDLVAQGVVVRQEGKVLGLFPTTSWPLADPAVRQEVLERVRATVVDGADPDERTGALVALVYSVDLLPKLFPEQRKRDIQARGKAVAHGDWGSEAVRRAIQDVQTAITAAIVATTVAASSGSG
ncbi:Golgi phosphoprotein 3 (GPP34) [Pedococcus dokdonensis]|uniref:Golgi phosphoprotein 3 (GPP34) n=1 Tax=Pedococcus dokdonensis TaxID=443156 RepID=A0A1H0NEP5_9MICO|nr:GPP34 family phosphoprotein [Pedococcus dokdonensis]SDO91247.1 Golgi phosphoprotein 3 (GPP34) [Pedococcus dokdonensis]